MKKTKIWFYGLVLFAIASTAFAEVSIRQVRDPVQLRSVLNNDQLFVDSIVEYLGDGLLSVSTLADSATTNKFKTTTTAYYTIDGIQYSRAALDNIEFSQADTINAGGATNTFYGSWVAQVNAAGAVSTLAATGQTNAVNMVYGSEAVALAAAQSIVPTVKNIKLAYIIVEYDATDEGDAGGTWTANASALDGNADTSYVNEALKEMPAR